MVEQIANAVATLLNGGIDSTVGSLTVDSATGFPAIGDYRIVAQDGEFDATNKEYMLVTGVAGSVFTVTRGQEGTAGVAHADNSYVAHVLTAEALRLLTGVPIRRIKASNESFSSTSFADSTGLTFPVAANRSYYFRFVVFFNTNAGAVGIKLGVNGPAGCTVKYGGFVPASAPSAAGSAIEHNAGSAFEIADFNPSAGPGADNTVGLIEGTLITTGTAGTLALRHASETATATTIEAGSYGELSLIA